jgi:hypothetical protein
MDFRLESARVVLADPKSIIISSKYGEFCDFWNSDFGWTPTLVNLVEVHPKNIYGVQMLTKNDSVESTFLRRRINVNSHTLSFHDSYS